MIKISTHSPKETQTAAKKIARQLKGGEVLTLTGPLGSGKTTFVRGLARGLGIKKAMTSPTFVIMNVHKIPKQNLHLYHFDLYRLRGQGEIYELGFSEIIQNPKNIMLIEWPEKIKNLLPSRAIKFRFAIGKKPNDRLIKIQ